MIDQRLINEPRICNGKSHLKVACYGVCGYCVGGVILGARELMQVRLYHGHRIGNPTHTKRDTAILVVFTRRSLRRILL